MHYDTCTLTGVCGEALVRVVSGSLVEINDMALHRHSLDFKTRVWEPLTNEVIFSGILSTRFQAKSARRI